MKELLANIDNDLCLRIPKTIIALYSLKENQQCDINFRDVHSNLIITVVIPLRDE